MTPSLQSGSTKMTPTLSSTFPFQSSAQGVEDGIFLSLLILMEERLEDMKQLEMPDHSMNKKWRLIRSHKWTTKKKLTMGVWILDVFHASHWFCLWQAILTNITGFSSILRLLWVHYYEKISFGNLTAEGWKTQTNWGCGALTPSVDLIGAQMEHKQDASISPFSMPTRRW